MYKRRDRLESDAQTKHKRFQLNGIKYQRTGSKRAISPDPATYSQGTCAQTMKCRAHFCTNDALTFPTLKIWKLHGTGAVEMRPLI